MMSKEKENVEGGPMDGPLFIDKDNIIAKGGIWESSKVNVPRYRQMVKEFVSNFEEGIDKQLKEGWLVKIVKTIEPPYGSETGILVIFERND